MELSRSIPLPQIADSAARAVPSGWARMPGDADVPHAPVGARGRGAGVNPANRFEDQRYLVAGEFLDDLRAEGQLSNQNVATMVFDDATRSILNPVDAPDLHFRWTLNPYRGCEHGCIYCYARPGHEYLGLSSGLDFETKVFAKREAPELLRKELAKKSWQGETIMMSGVTDCYQPLEADLKLTRRCLEVMLEFRQSVSIITKSSLILRDLDILKEMARLNLVHAAVSITTLDNRLAGAMEPRAASPRARLDTVRTLARAGVPTFVMAAPIVPGLNDHEIPSILREASRAGAGGRGLHPPPTPIPDQDPLPGVAPAHRAPARRQGRGPHPRYQGRRPLRRPLESPPAGRGRRRRCDQGHLPHFSQEVQAGREAPAPRHFALPPARSDRTGPVHRTTGAL